MNLNSLSIFTISFLAEVK